MQGQARLALIIVIALLAAAACGGGGGTTTTAAPPLVADTTLPGAPTTMATTTTAPAPATTQPPGVNIELVNLVADGTLAVDVTSPEGGVSGELLDVTVRNQSADDLVVLIPCGFVFAPEEAAEQRMMVVQEAEASVAPGETVVLTPYVMCIDASLGAPGSGSAYGLGIPAESDLAALAECVCKHDLAAELDPLLGDMSLQMAVWAAADGEFTTISAEELADAQSALGELVGGELGLDLESIAEAAGVDVEDLEDLTGIPGFDFESMLESAEQFMGGYQDKAAAWLTECGIDLGQ